MNAGNNRTNLLVVGYGDGKAVMTIQGSDGTVADWGQNTHLGGSRQRNLEYEKMRGVRPKTTRRLT